MRFGLRFLLTAGPVAAAMLAIGCASGEKIESEATRVEAPEIRARMAKYAPTPMEVDLSAYSDREKALLGKLLEAAGLADEIFWRQTSSAALPLRQMVLAAYPEGHPLRAFYLMQMGPYDRLDENAVFMRAPRRPPGGAYYVPDLTAAELGLWLDAHPGDRAALLSPYTVVRRSGDGLVAEPYHEAYSDLVGPLATSLRQAADLAENESFTRYLRAKATAVLTDSYFDADTAWIAMDGSKFDLQVGPFEVYDDELMNIKAAYQASVEIVDAEESGKLELYKRYLADLEKNLPYDDRYKPQGAELTASFTIVRDIYRGGLLRVGYQPVANNLPNDPRVQSEFGTKKTFWKNVLDARLNQIILPISRQLVAQDQVQYVTPQGYFDFVLLHEMAHGLGPRYAETPEGNVPVNQTLTTLYSWIEENKADLAGLHSLRYLVGAGAIDSTLDRQHYASYLGSLFRTIRFGTTEAHGLAALVSLNFFVERGAITYDPATGRYAVDFERLPEAVTELARELLTIEATGDFDRAKAVKERYGAVGPQLKAALDRVQDVPVDLVPEYRIHW